MRRRHGNHVQSMHWVKQKGNEKCMQNMCLHSQKVKIATKETKKEGHHAAKSYVVWCEREWKRSEKQWNPNIYPMVPLIDGVYNYHNSNLSVVGDKRTIWAVIVEVMALQSTYTHIGIPIIIQQLHSSCSKFYWFIILLDPFFYLQ